jgi:hypothetical protein
MTSLEAVVRLVRSTMEAVLSDVADSAKDLQRFGILSGDNFRTFYGRKLLIFIIS